MSCPDCTKCLNHIDGDCVKYTGKSYPDLGVENGESLVKVIDKLLSKVKELQDSKEDCNNCN